ncbi:unnamed protein product [Caenorhabditis bovis]|uniref:Tyrosine-protein kinase n=1 Tax=Caenorhabditis bovis TaxID=2654633 RepID=A0A8S1EQS7_9PELO|nr:unnamed protein product [Caenorhabditis bovis]
MNREDKLALKIAKWLIQQTFYHGYLPREDLVFVLKRKGDYIVRTTERPSPKGRRRELVLSIAWPENPKSDGTLNLKDIKNLVIERGHELVYIDATIGFPGLDKLFEYYRNNGIKIPKSKTPVQLLHPVGLCVWEFRHSQVTLIKKVGQGAYGEVYKGKMRKGKAKSVDVAVKTMRADVETNDELMREIMAEARLMRALNHPNIVRIRGVALLEQPLYIIIDFIGGGGLDSYLKKNSKTLTKDDKNKMAISAAWGIEFMHSQDIMHRDIAARNCLYDPKNYVKLSDFGLSRKGNVYKMKKCRKMPTKWLAPESLSAFTFYKSSDVFTYGILLYEIYTCSEPYKGITGGEAKKRILAGEFLSIDKDAPKELVEIVKKNVFLLDHRKRATMKEIVKALEEWLQIELELEAPEDDKESLVSEIAFKKQKAKLEQLQQNLEIGEQMSNLNEADSKASPTPRKKANSNAPSTMSTLGPVSVSQTPPSKTDRSVVKLSENNSKEKDTVRDKEKEKKRDKEKDDDKEKEKESPNHESARRKTPVHKDTREKEDLNPTQDYKGSNESDKESQKKKKKGTDSEKSN